MVTACAALRLSPLGSLAEADNPQNAPPVQLGVCIQLGSPGGQRSEQVGELGGWPQLQVPRQNAVHGHPGLQPSIALQSRYQLSGHRQGHAGACLRSAHHKVWCLQSLLSASSYSSSDSLSHYTREHWLRLWRKKGKG